MNHHTFVFKRVDLSTCDVMINVLANKYPQNKYKSYDLFLVLLNNKNTLAVVAINL